ncbi:type II secretion system protein [bacterium]|nr:type II secretion system protein [bacterium]
MRATLASRRAFTLIELLVVMGVIAVLAGMLLPTLQRARESGRRVNCASNLRQLAIAMQNYREGNDDWYPPMYVSGTPPSRWMNVIKTYVETYDVYDCPSSKHLRCAWDEDIYLGYGMNVFNFDGEYACFWYLVKETVVAAPSTTILLADSQGGSYYVGGGNRFREPVEYVGYRHARGFCAVFCDTHTEHLERTTKRLWSLTKKNCE